MPLVRRHCGRRTPRAVLVVPVLGCGVRSAPGCGDFDYGHPDGLGQFLLALVAGDDLVGTAQLGRGHVEDIERAAEEAGCVLAGQQVSPAVDPRPLGCLAGENPGCQILVEIVQTAPHGLAGDAPASACGQNGVAQFGFL